MSHIVPWTVLDSATTFADPWLRVRSDHVRTPGGDVFGPFHVIEYPDWVSVVALTQAFRLIMVRKYRHGIGQVAVGLPGGLVDAADGSGRAAAEAAAARELREETGYGGGALELLATLHPNPSSQTNTASCYLVTSAVRRGDAVAGVGEHQETFEAELVDVLEELRGGRLTLHAVHAPTLWSAAARIAGDATGRFGPLTAGLGRFFSGQEGRSSAAASHVAAIARATIGG